MITRLMYRHAKNMRDEGRSAKFMMKILGVSRQRLKYILRVISRHERWIETLWGDRKGLSQDALRAIKRFCIRSRADCMWLAADVLPMRGTHVRVPGVSRHPWQEPREIPIKTANDIRKWLGVPPYVLPPRIPTAAALEKARRLLESQGWRVQPPDDSSDA